jgi:hypothetical protein
VLVAEGDAAALALRTDGLDAMQGAIGLATPVLSEPYAPLRTMEICRDNGFVLSAVERRGSAGFFMEEQGDAAAYREALAAFAARPRLFEAERDGMAELGRLIAAHARELAPGRLADAFFRAEREYWEERNAAARIQRVRQDRFGLGWGNHDHHTFRSSREQFRPLLEIFTRLGFAFREQFHAGARAGWGAQVMEHPEAGLVVFADVDLSEEEQDHDFVRQGLVPRNHRGTVGLWVALHGEGILAAGMHHLAVRVRFDAAHGDLPAHGARMMEPFSYLRFLKQAFTEAELWPVDAGRAARLVDEGVLSSRQAMGFVESGALGSHLEIIQRDRGFRGFNQGSVSAIIRETDPRLEGERGA